MIEAERILARVASKPLADRLTKLHEDNGVQVLTGVGVDSINAESGIFESVTSTSGENCWRHAHHWHWCFSR